MGPGTKTAWQHDGRMLADGEVTLLRRRLEPADPQPVARRADRARLQDPRSAPRRPPTRTPTRRCSPPARATCRRSPDGNARRRLRRRARDQRVRRGRLAAVRRPPAVRHVLLPRLPLPLERAPAEPARGARQPEQHRRRDDRARELERRDRSRLLARARGQAAGVAHGAGHDPGRAASRARRPCPRSTPTWRCRRSTRPAACSAPRRRSQPISYAASLPSDEPASGSVGRFGLVLVRRRRRASSSWWCARASSCCVGGGRARFAAAPRHRERARQDGQQR